MKILYITGDGPDYLSDTIFHGLRSLYGTDVVDEKPIGHMYKSALPHKSSIYGRGFTVFCLLDDIPVDRTDIFQKIRLHYYDLIIFGSIWRNSTLLELVASVYYGNQIVMLDGEDHQGIHPARHRGLYFKRECTVERCLPIGFSIPKKKIVSAVPKKDRELATVIPGDPATYIFTDEDEYRKDYQRSWFGVTHKKAGWDCMRHYELIANGCIPLFKDIEYCPALTLTHYPKTLCQAALTRPSDLDARMALAEAFLDRAHDLTTEKMAQYVLEKTGLKP